MEGNPMELRRSGLSEQIANALEAEILEGGKVGGRLASEQQMVERFGASRTAVREALKILCARGLIDSRTGSGAYITKPDVSDLTQMVTRIIRMDGIDYRSIYEVRGFLEAGAVRMAVQHASDAELSELEDILMRLRNYNLGVLERRDLDFAFHNGIARLSGNPLLSLLVDTMANVFKEIIRTGIFVEGGIEDGIVRHQRIMDALYARDASAAERMIYEHLEQSRKNYEVYYKI